MPNAKTNGIEHVGSVNKKECVLFGVYYNMCVWLVGKIRNEKS